MEAPGELQVTRQDLLQLAPVSSRAPLVVLPSGKGKKSRIAVIDDSGILQCLEVKKGIATGILKTVMPEGKVECITTNATAAADRAGDIESNVSRVDAVDSSACRALLCGTVTLCPSCTCPDLPLSGFRAARH
jgi:hypothetical protein